MRPYNFGAGPATLPEAILLEAQAELLDWQGLGMSVVEVSHRSDAFIELMHEAKAALCALLNIPAHYHVLFLPFPARTQFAMVPMNLLAHQAHQQGAYLLTGTWSKLAYQEALHLASAYALDSIVQDQTRYLYFTPNETIEGFRTSLPPLTTTQGVPVVADMTSCLLSEPLTIEDYGLIFAGAQKNVAPAALTLVIIREDLLCEDRVPGLPTMLNYTTHARTQSLYATPAQFQCYMALKMFRWLQDQGGVRVVAELNQVKADKLYALLDASNLYQTRVPHASRSRMNVCFFMQDESLESAFLQQAKARGLHGLKGHKAVGGLRASLYNAMPLAGVEALIDFMQDFERAHWNGTHA